MPYCELSYHLVWTTAIREPVIDTQLESRLHRYMQKKALNLGAIVFAVNGAADHVHMVVSVPPKLSLANFVGKVKGVSSHDISQDLGRRFQWQAGYGLLSFDRKRRPNYVEYVENQKRHHAEGATHRVLEHTSDSGPEVSEQVIPYGKGADEWRRELEAWSDDEHSAEARHDLLRRL
jgi:putative transposase